MVWVFIAVYLLVGLGAFVGGRDAGESAWRAGWIAVTWPVYLLVGLGRAMV